MTLRAGVSHSDIFGYNACCQLTEAFRRLLRPSSPPTAKASTVCAYSLDHITRSPRFELYSSTQTTISILCQFTTTTRVSPARNDAQTPLATCSFFKEHRFRAANPQTISACGFCSCRVSSSIDAPSTQLEALPQLFNDSECDTTVGGASRDRTDDPLLAKQVLSQLSYGPILRVRQSRTGGSRWTRTIGLTLIRGAPSNHLSHRPSAAEPSRLPAYSVHQQTATYPTAPTAPAVPCSQVSLCLVWALESDFAADSKGGDPAAPSDTATLLRLHPSH